MSNADLKIEKNEDLADAEFIFDTENPSEAEIRTRLEAIRDADVRCFYDDVGKKVLPINQWPKREALALQSYSFNEKSQTHSFKFADRIKALDNLARMDGLYEKDHSQKNPFKDLFEGVERSMLLMILKRLQDMGDVGVREIPAEKLVAIEVLGEPVEAAQPLLGVPSDVEIIDADEISVI